MIQKIQDFLKNRDPQLCVLATSSLTGIPQCAVMGYAVTDDLNLILSTDKTSRKVVNIKTNPQVALVFGWLFTELNVQIQGEARLIESGQELKTCEEIYFASHPESVEFKGLPETIFIKIKPLWLRLSDYSVDPPWIQEMSI